MLLIFLNHEEVLVVRDDIVGDAVDIQERSFEHRLWHVGAKFRIGLNCDRQAPPVLVGVNDKRHARKPQMEVSGPTAFDSTLFHNMQSHRIR